MAKAEDLPQSMNRKGSAKTQKGQWGIQMRLILTLFGWNILSLLPWLIVAISLLKVRSSRPPGYRMMSWGVGIIIAMSLFDCGETIGVVYNLPSLEIALVSFYNVHAVLAGLGLLLFSVGVWSHFKNRHQSPATVAEKLPQNPSATP